VADKILVLDDNEPLVDAIRAILEREGYAVATGLIRRIEDVESCAPQLIIIDAPPGKRGSTVNFVQRIRLNAPTAKIPVIIMTTLFKPIETTLLRERDIEVINKPFELEELLGAVSGLLKHCKQTAASND